MKLVTAEEMRRVEAAAEAAGTPTSVLMERAGAAVAEVILSDFGPAPGPVLVLVGPGNNGGDGLVAARVLHEAGAPVSVYAWRHATDDPGYQAAAEAGVPITRAEEDAKGARLAAVLAEADIIVDALLGTGATRPIEGPLAQLLRRVRERKRDDASVVAVDLPSGVNADTGAADAATLPADVTVTFGFPKLGLFQFPAAGLLGELVTADIGLGDELAEEVRVSLIEADWVRAQLPVRAVDAHKGSFGKALIVAGSVTYTGAAYLAGAAATRVGAGLVTLAVPHTLYPILAARLVEATWLILPQNLGVITTEAVRLVTEKVADYNALLVGPGLGREGQAGEAVQRLLLGHPAAQRGRRLGFHPPTETEEGGALPTLPPLVVDADGLNALAEAEAWWTALKAPAILTPHPGEMARLLDTAIAEVEADRLGTARRAAERFGQVVVLKGAHTVVAAPDGRAAVSPFANPALATAGTGDVLAGAIVGFLAQGLAPFEAAAVGVYVHGLAGERVRGDFGDAGAVASDLLPNLPLAMHTVRLEE